TEGTKQWLESEYSLYRVLLKQREEKLNGIRELEEQIASWFACDVLMYKEQLQNSNSNVNANNGNMNANINANANANVNANINANVNVNANANANANGNESKTTELITRPNLNEYCEKREKLKQELKKLDVLCENKEFFLHKGKVIKEANMVVMLATQSAAEAKKLQQLHNEQAMEEFGNEVQDLPIGQKLVCVFFFFFKKKKKDIEI
ncbi:outer membrane protein, partial [Reticulomyxa filosa]